MALEDKIAKPTVVVETEVVDTASDSPTAAAAGNKKEREDLTLVPVDESLLIKASSLSR